MAKLTRYKSSKYFTQYAILQYVQVDDTYITSQIIYPRSNSRIRFKRHDGLQTLTEAKEHFQKINWTNGIKVPFNITTFKFIRGDVV